MKNKPINNLGPVSEVISQQSPKLDTPIKVNHLLGLAGADLEKFKIEMIKTLFAFFARKENTPERIRDGYSHWLQTVKNGLGPEVEQKSEEARGIQDRLARMEEEIGACYGEDEDVNPEKENLFDKLSEERDQLGEKLYNLSNDESVWFLNVCTRASGLLDGKIGEFNDKIAQDHGVEKVIFSNLGAFHMVPYNHTDGHLSKNRGIHYRGTIDNYVRERKFVYNRDNYKEMEGFYLARIVRGRSEQSDIRQTIEHENIHNYFDLFPELKGYTGINFIENSIDRWISASRMNSTFHQVLGKALHRNLLRYANQSREEIIANFEDLSKRRKMATEGAFFGNICKILDKAREKLPPNSDEIKEEFDEIYQEFLRHYREFYVGLADLFFVGEYTNIKDDIRACMLLYRPSEYDTKLFPYIKRLIGEETYDLLTYARKILDCPFFKTNFGAELLYATFGERYDNGPIFDKNDIEHGEVFNYSFLQELVLKLSKVDANKIPATFKTRLESYILSRNYRHIGILGIETKEDMNRFMKLLTELGKQLNIEMDSKKIRGYIYRSLQKKIKGIGNNR